MSCLDEPTATEVEAIERATAAAWAKGLSVDEYVEREVVLFAHPFACAFLRKRVLRDRPGGRVLASFDAVRTDSREGPVLTIATVWVDPDLRGHDHARRMLDRALGEARAAGFAWSVLYSDIGARFYEKLGFRLGPAEVATFRTDGAAAAAARAAVRAVRIEPVKEESIEPAIETVRAFRAGLGRHVTLLPTAGFLDWHLERFRFFSRLRPSVKWDGRVGARTPAGGVGIFAPNARDRTVEVFALAPRDPSDLRVLLGAACERAAEDALDSVKVWLRPDPLVPGPDLTPDAVEPAFAMALPLGARRPPEPWTWASVERVDWA